MHTPLVRRFATTSATEALETLFPTPGGHLEIEPLSDDFRAHVRKAEIGQVVLVRAEWRDAVIHSNWRPHFGAHLPICGSVSYDCSDAEPRSTGVVTIASASPVKIRFEGMGRILVVAAPPDVVREAVERSGIDTHSENFDRTLPRGDARAGLFARHAQFVWNELSRGDLSQAPMAMAETENALVARIAALFGVGQADRRAETSPRVARAQQFIENNIERPLRAAEIADAAGVSGPTLSREFRKHVGISPVAYARACRLDRAHQHLSCAERGETSVAAIAARWGFTHLGEFAAAYARRFGERPSDTLRR